jgi:hypothetical protein
VVPFRNFLPKKLERYGKKSEKGRQEKICQEEEVILGYT